MKNKVFRKAFINNNFTGGSSFSFIRFMQIWLHNRKIKKKYKWNDIERLDDNDDNPFSCY